MFHAPSRSFTLVGLLIAVLSLGWLKDATPGFAGATVRGDVNCSAGPNSVDSLFILRHVAQLPITLPQNCPELGSLGSPTNGLVAYSLWDGQAYNIYSMNPDGSDATLLTDGPVFDTAPAWSPDGGRIAFERYIGAENDVLVMNGDGTNVVNLTNSADAADSSPSWSPDGSKIAFASDRDGDYDIWVMDADGTNPQNLTADHDGYDETPDWSPDGSQIVFASERLGDYLDLFIMNSDGSDVTSLETSPGYEAAPSWSPDGGHIAFYMRSPDNFDIYTIRSDGTGRMRLTDDPARDAGPDWSPDGTMIAFNSRRDNVDPLNCNNCNEEIYVMNADGSSETRLTNSIDEEESPSWQPLGALKGDVNCDGVVDSVDSLFILRYVAGLPVNLPPGCPEIGS